ncbi:HAD family hydrolase [Cerasicoccus frondis]|uniref:HAD family hydrolase n=1 Tax=Cerasicoccus frondis TaxID=490090 RepID=UPI0028527177|nr:HAD family hydrolase [Cerasicoccus frondis]
MSVSHSLNRRRIVACVWDFDKTLIPGYMQEPLFRRYKVDGKQFWQEVNELPKIYAERGVHVSPDTVYLNHLLSYIKNGPLKGLRNSILRELGAELPFYPGLPDFFQELTDFTKSEAAYRKHDIQLEHYIISTGLAEMIRGSKIADAVDGVFGCEFIEAPLPPYYLKQNELSIPMDFEISQIGVMVDNTIKTRYIFEINKGSNKNPDISVNAKMLPEDRRVPMENMIYIADGPSDVPVFSVVRRNGGKTFAVYDPERESEFLQNDQLLQDGRVDSYGPADYTPTSQSHRWIKMQVRRICDRLVVEGEAALALRVKKPPQHLHPPEKKIVEPGPEDEQKELFE